MERMKKICTGMDEKLAVMLLDPAAASARVQTHLEECGHCRRELEELRAAMNILDAWEAPEPNPYFLTRLDARLREEREAAPAGWFARLRASFVYGPRTHVRPLAAMALTIMLLVGGGTYLGLTDWEQPAAPGQAVVHDLQTMDSNAQLLDQLEALSSSNDNGD
jgi:anti-sigma factor RsiW